MKDHDLFMDMVANPDLTLDNYLELGFSTENTQLLTPDIYKNTERIRNNPQFQNEKGEFDENKFNNAYQGALQAFNYMSANKVTSDMLKMFTPYDQSNIFAPANSPKYQSTPQLITRPNQLQQSWGLTGVNLRGPQIKTEDEIAQQKQVLANPNEAYNEDGSINYDKAIWHEAPEGLFTSGYWTDFFDTRVLAQWDEDGTHIDPVTGDEVQHVKGELKVDADGTPYYENLAGRDVYGRRVLNRMNLITKESSPWNKYDFFDSDDLDQKNVVGVVARNLALVGSMFIPYAGPVIAGFSAGTQVLGMLATLGKMLTFDSNSPVLSAVEGWAQSWNRQYGKTQYAQTHTWCPENFIDTFADLIAQLREQRVIFQTVPGLLKGEFILKDKGKFSVEALNAKTLEKYMKIAKDENSPFFKSLLKNEMRQTGSGMAAVKVSMQGPALATLQATHEVEEFLSSYNQIGGMLSKAYMAGLISQGLYGEAKQAGLNDYEATAVTAGRFLAEMALLNTPIGDFLFPELRYDGIRYSKLEEQLYAPIRETRGKVNVSTPVQKTNWFIDIMKRAFGAGQDAQAAAQINGGSMIKTAFVMGTEAGLVNDIEEGLNDLAKAAYNTVDWFASDTNQGYLTHTFGEKARWKNFENSFDRYAMGFASGLVGGGITSAVSSYKPIRQLGEINSRSKALQQLVYMVRNGEAPKFIKWLNKHKVGSTELSDFMDENGQYLPVSEEHPISQDEAMKQLVVDQVRLIDQIINENHGNLSDDSFINVALMKDLRTQMLAGRKVGDLMVESPVTGRYLNYYNTLLNDIIVATSKVEGTGVEVTDGNKKKAEAAKEIDTQAKQELENKQQLLKDLLDGKLASKFQTEALFDMSIGINSLIAGNLTTKAGFVKTGTGRNYNDLSQKEKDEWDKKWENWNKSAYKADFMIDLADSVHALFSKISGDLLKHEGEYQAIIANGTYTNILSQLDNAFKNLSYIGKIQEGQESFADIVQQQIDNTMALLFKDQYDNNPVLQQLTKEKEALMDQITENPADPSLFEKLNQVYKDIVKESSNLVMNTALQQLQKLLQAPFLNSEIKAQALYLADQVYEVTKAKYGIKNKDDFNRIRENIYDTLMYTSADIDTLEIIQDYLEILKNLKNKGYSAELINDENSDLYNALDVLVPIAQAVAPIIGKKTDNISIYEALDQIDQLTLTSTPGFENKDFVNDVIDIIDNSLNFYNETEKLADEIAKYKGDLGQVPNSPLEQVVRELELAVTNDKKVGDILNLAFKLWRDNNTYLEEITIDDETLEKIEDARRVLSIATAAVIAARTDQMSMTDVFGGYNAALNNLNSKTEGWVPLAEISGELADSLQADMSILYGKLDLLSTLAQANATQKLKYHNKLGLNINYLIYQRLRNIIIDGKFLQKGSISTAAQDKLKELTHAIEQSELLKKFYSPSSEGRLRLGKEDQLKVEEELIKICDMFYDLMNSDEMQKNMLDKEWVKTNILPHFNLFKASSQVLTEKSEALEEHTALNYLFAIQSVRYTDFKNAIVKAAEKKNSIAPLPAQEQEILIAIAPYFNKQGAEVLTQSVQEYLKSTWKSMDKEERKKYLDSKNQDRFTDRDIDEYILNLFPCLRYSNVSVIEGGSGVGKSTGILYFIKEILGDKANARAVVAHTSEQKAKDLAAQLELTNPICLGIIQDSEQKDQKLLYDYFFKNLEYKRQEGSNIIEVAKDQYTFDEMGVIKPILKDEQIVQLSSDKVPSIIYIDEFSQLDQMHFDALVNVAKKLGIHIILSGDLMQSSFIGQHKVSLNNGTRTETNYLKLVSDNFFHGFKLGAPMRTDNNLKTLNYFAFQNVQEGKSLTLNLRFFEDKDNLVGDKVINVKYNSAEGIELTNEAFQEAMATIKKMVELNKAQREKAEKLQDEKEKKRLLQMYSKVGYIFSNSNSKIYRAIQSDPTLKNEIIFQRGSTAQGLEKGYYIVEPDCNLDQRSQGFNSQFFNDLYTGATRAQRASLLLIPTKNISNADNLQEVVNTRERSFMGDTYSSRGIQRYSAIRVENLKSIIKDPKELKVRAVTSIDTGGSDPTVLMATADNVQAFGTPTESLGLGYVPSKSGDPNYNNIAIRRYTFPNKVKVDKTWCDTFIDSSESVENIILESVDCYSNDTETFIWVNMPDGKCYMLKSDVVKSPEKAFGQGITEFKGYTINNQNIVDNSNEIEENPDNKEGQPVDVDPFGFTPSDDSDNVIENLFNAQQQIDELESEEQEGELSEEAQRVKENSEHLRVYTMNGMTYGAEWDPSSGWKFYTGDNPGERSDNRFDGVNGIMQIYKWIVRNTVNHVNSLTNTREKQQARSMYSTLLFGIYHKYLGLVAPSIDFNGTKVEDTQNLSVEDQQSRLRNMKNNVDDFLGTIIRMSQSSSNLLSISEFVKRSFELHRDQFRFLQKFAEELNDVNFGIWNAPRISNKSRQRGNKFGLEKPSNKFDTLDRHDDETNEYCASAELETDPSMKATAQKAPRRSFVVNIGNVKLPNIPLSYGLPRLVVTIGSIMSPITLIKTGKKVGGKFVPNFETAYNVWQDSNNQGLNQAQRLSAVYEAITDPSLSMDLRAAYSNLAQLIKMYLHNQANIVFLDNKIDEKDGIVFNHLLSQSTQSGAKFTSIRGIQQESETLRYTAEQFEKAFAKNSNSWMTLEQIRKNPKFSGSTLKVYAHSEDYIDSGNGLSLSGIIDPSIRSNKKLLKYKLGKGHPFVLIHNLSSKDFENAGIIGEENKELRYYLQQFGKADPNSTALLHPSDPRAPKIQLFWVLPPSADIATYLTGLVNGTNKEAGLGNIYDIINIWKKLIASNEFNQLAKTHGQWNPASINFIKKTIEQVTNLYNQDNTKDLKKYLYAPMDDTEFQEIRKILGLAIKTNPYSRALLLHTLLKQFISPYRRDFNTASQSLRDEYQKFSEEKKQALVNILGKDYQVFYRLKIKPQANQSFNKIFELQIDDFNAVKIVGKADENIITLDNFDIIRKYNKEAYGEEGDSNFKKNNEGIFIDTRSNSESRAGATVQDYLGLKPRDTTVFGQLSEEQISILQQMVTDKILTQEELDHILQSDIQIAEAWTVINTKFRDSQGASKYVALVQGTELSFFTLNDSALSKLGKITNVTRWTNQQKNLTTIYITDESGVVWFLMPNPKDKNCCYLIISKSSVPQAPVKPTLQSGVQKTQIEQQISKINEELNTVSNLLNCFNPKTKSPIKANIIDFGKKHPNITEFLGSKGFSSNKMKKLLDNVFKDNPLSDLQSGQVYDELIKISMQMKENINQLNIDLQNINNIDPLSLPLNQLSVEDQEIMNKYWEAKERYENLIKKMDELEKICNSIISIIK